MDGRLSEAAQAGDVDHLLHLIRNEPLILSAVALEGGESPLHIASMAGHLDFVREILKYRKEFAAELNSDGLSPLHIASAIGEIEIVKELLSVDQNLFLIEGKELRIPLHYASIKGRVEIIKELLSACPDSIDKSTVRRETSLHLAVKYHQIEAFKVLSDHITKFKKEGVLNKKDSQGNTILHLAVVKKQYEVIDFMLRGNVLTHGSLDVNSLDERGLTPFDVLLLVQNETGDREIEEILRQAGAIRSRDLLAITTNSPVSSHPSLENSQTTSKELKEFFKYKKDRDPPSEVRNCMLVLAVIIATATYQAVLSLPGGVWQDDCKTNSNNTNGTARAHTAGQSVIGTNDPGFYDLYLLIATATYQTVLSPPGGVWQEDSMTSSNNTNGTAQAHTAGQSVMGTKSPVSFGIFLFSNTVGFSMSLYMINFLTYGFPLYFELQVAIFALSCTYGVCIGELTPGKNNSKALVIFSAAPFAIFVVIKVSRDYLRIVK